jgi:hypothetical protein
MKKERLLFLILGLGFLSSSCGRIWGSINWTPNSSICLSSYSSQVLSDSPVGYWRFIETTGTTAFDLGSGDVNAIYGANTILGQPSAILGFGNYSAFNNTAFSPPDTAEILSYPLAPMAINTLTVETWVKASAPGYDVEIQNNNGGVTKGFEFDINSGGQFWMRKDGAAGPFTFGVWPNDTNWHHVALVTNNINITVYVDGNNAGSQADATVYSPCDATCTLQIGNEAGTAFMEEVAIYNTALSQARIQAHYNAGLTCH